MGRPAGWMKQFTGREAMQSPGAPSHRREIERKFWLQIAQGITSEKAAEAVGASQAVGARWFRHRGGMPLFMSKPVSNRMHSFPESGEFGTKMQEAELGYTVRSQAAATALAENYVGLPLQQNG